MQRKALLIAGLVGLTCAAVFWRQVSSSLDTGASLSASIPDPTPPPASQPTLPRALEDKRPSPEPAPSLAPSAPDPTLSPNRHIASRPAPDPAPERPIQPKDMSMADLESRLRSAFQSQPSGPDNQARLSDAVMELSAELGWTDGQLTVVRDTINDSEGAIDRMSREIQDPDELFAAIAEERDALREEIVFQIGEENTLIVEDTIRELWLEGVVSRPLTLYNAH